MTSQYDFLADQYDLSFQLTAIRPYVEAYSVYQLLGDVSERRVIDLATGTGYYARLLKNLGASAVVGVDVAEMMVNIAKQAEQANPLGIEYHVQDVTTFKADAPFDLALAVYLLHYAPSIEALQAMCNNIAHNLVAGGRFITYILSYDLARVPNYYDFMGLNLRFESETPYDGEPVPFSVTLGGQTTPEVVGYRREKATVEAALAGAGFVNIQWHAPQLSPEGEAKHGKAYFDAYLKQPHALLITCDKA